VSGEPRNVVFLDVETNGRYVERGHEAWEVAWWNLTTGHRDEFFVNIPDVPAFMGRAEPIALRVGKFLDRYPFDDTAPSKADTESAMITMYEGIRPDRSGPAPVLLGSNPGFDAGFLAALARRFALEPEPFHYHPIDLGSYAAGVLGRELGTESLSAASVARMCGLDPGGHSAGGDVTSGGAAYLLLRQAARVARHDGEQSAAAWLTEWRDAFDADGPALTAARAIKQFGPALATL
jgi:hypothetical protein